MLFSHLHSDLQKSITLKCYGNSLHYSKHHAAYVKKNLNTALAGTADEKLKLKRNFCKISTMPAAVRNNGGGHYNHELFWSVFNT